MGQLTEPDSEHRIALRCKDCETDYWTDETQTNDCPECGSVIFEVVDLEGEAE